MTRLIAAIVVAVAALSTASPARRIELTGARFNYQVKSGDTLTLIGARYGVAARTLATTNDIADPGVIVAGTALLIDNRHLAAISPSDRLTINIAQRMLFIVDGSEVTAYPVGVGRRDWPTPTGPFRVISKETNPTWDVPESIREEMRHQGKTAIRRMPPSPENPLGAHWMGLSLPGLGIHGTVAPSSVYQFISHGCIRLHPDDIAALYARVSVGDSGLIVYEPLLMAVIDDDVFIEAHEDAYGRLTDDPSFARRLAERDGLVDRVDWLRAAEVLTQRLGIAVDVTRR